MSHINTRDDLETGRIETDIPARLDRLPWCSWHWWIGGGLVEAFLGVRAEGRPLESIAQPLTAEAADQDLATP